MILTKTIALIIPQIGGGGAEKVAADLSIYFTQKGYKVIFFIKNKHIRGEYRYSGTVEVIPISYVYQRVTLGKSLNLLCKDAIVLKRLKKKYKVDVAISFMQDCNLLNIASRGKEKVIVTLHNVVSQRKDLVQNISNNQWTYKYLYQLADKIIFVSKYCRKDWLKHYGDILHKTAVVYNPIGEKRLDQTKKLPMYGEDVVISVARFDEIKRPWHIIRMFSKVLDVIPNAQLLMIGEGELLFPMKKLAKNMGMDKQIIFLGKVDNVEDYLNIAKVFVTTSASEAFPCSVIEAIGCGVPVVANDCPGGIKESLGIREELNAGAIIRCNCGSLTMYLDGKKYGATDALTIEEIQMADEVCRILLDMKMNDKYSKNCKKQARKFNINNIGMVWEKIIE